jgi:hypothetical protein
MRAPLRKGVSPENIVLRTIWHRLLQEVDQSPHDRVEMLVHRFGAPFGCVNDLGAEGSVDLPAGMALAATIEVRVEKRALYGRSTILVGATAPTRFKVSDA